MPYDPLTGKGYDLPPWALEFMARVDAEQAAERKARNERAKVRAFIRKHMLERLEKWQALVDQGKLGSTVIVDQGAIKTVIIVIDGKVATIMDYVGKKLVWLTPAGPWNKKTQIHDLPNGRILMSPDVRINVENGRITRITADGREVDTTEASEIQGLLE